MRSTLVVLLLALAASVSPAQAQAQTQAGGAVPLPATAAGAAGATPPPATGAAPTPVLQSAQPPVLPTPSTAAPRLSEEPTHGPAQAPAGPVVPPPGAIDVSDFRQVSPATRAPADLPTRARLWAEKDGLHLLMEATQPVAVTKAAGSAPRDADNPPADEMALNADFLATGQGAYFFVVTRGNGLRDGQRRDPQDSSRDWDGEWRGAAYETATGWAAEWVIPWRVAAQAPAGADGTRALKVRFSRIVRATGREYAWPATPTDLPTLVAQLAPVTLPAFETRTLQLFPYASAGFDRLTGGNREKIGLDAFYRAPGTQAALAIYPDFGQVESDQIVVNFSAIEVFRSDKRPFFTENQTLFDLQAPNGDRLLNTRRIGAAPDVGPEGFTDLIGAAKVTKTLGLWDVGALGAREENSSAADGRTTAVGRLRRRFEGPGWQANAGYLGTYVDHPTIERQAQVHSVDAEWRSDAGNRLAGQWAFADVRQPDADLSGNAGWLSAEHAPAGAVWQYRGQFQHIGRDYDANDAGYQARRSLNQARLRTIYTYRPAAGNAPDQGDKGRDPKGVQEAALQFQANPRTDDGGRWLLWQGLADLGVTQRDGGGYEGVLVPQVRGFDNLITRGGNPVLVESKVAQLAVYRNTPLIDGRFQASYGLSLTGQDTLSGHGLQPQAQVTFTPSPKAGLTLTAVAVYTTLPDWLLWQGGNEVGTFRQREIYSSLRVDWVPSPAHELRAKVEWVGGRADGRRLYSAGADGTLAREDGTPSDFSYSTAGFQVRYRYQWAPLAELFVVWGRGGTSNANDDQRGTGGLLRGAFARGNRTADQWLVKVRYPFTFDF